MFGSAATSLSKPLLILIVSIIMLQQQQQQQKQQQQQQKQQQQQRLLLLLLLLLRDRDFDLLTMLQHTWLYGALIHDLLKLRLNRVTVTTTEEGGKRTTTKTFDLEKRDVFWREHAFSPFPVAAAAVSQMLAEYNSELARVGARAPDAFAQPEFTIDRLGFNV
ncbi:sec1 family domain-containing protein, putative [Eimeria brunetti]|uniref:Sec1 family domain-containing protein, putative n=1 Tax=Eimeria brunetti TaxID=51314 RepID=U6LAV7_9EIME|nr:sec1 family domain-containing protein, putative [Eimeria brunetti]